MAESAKMLVRMAPRDVAMFRFLLEAYDNLAFFTVLERKTALLKLVFSGDDAESVAQALEQIGQAVPLTIAPWPDFGQCGDKRL